MIMSMMRRLTSVAMTFILVAPTGLVAIGAGIGMPPAIQVSLASGLKWSSGDAIRSFVLGGLQGSLSDEQKPESFALSDRGIWGQRSWGCADPSTQGSLIAEKLLVFGSAEDVAWVRTGLHNTPVEEDGTVWAAESSPNHMDSGGSWEANAEFLLSAALYAAHTADTRAFTTNSERLVCYRPANAAARQSNEGHDGFVIAGRSGLGDTQCNRPPRDLSLVRHGPGGDEGHPSATAGDAHGEAGEDDVGEEMELLAPEWPNTAYTAGRGLESRGKILGQVVEIPEPFTELSLPLVRHTGGGFWPILVEVFDETTGDQVAELSVAEAHGLDWRQWAVVRMPGGARSPGRYTITLRLDPERTEQPKTSGFWFSAGWVTRSGTPAPGGLAFVRTLSPRSSSGEPLLSGRMGTALGEKCTRAAALQLAMARRNATEYGILVIEDARFRGTDEADVVPGTSYWDLLNMGYKSAYINVRFLQSLLAIQQLVEAGLMETPIPGQGHHQLQRIIRQVKADFLTQFGASDGALVSWIGCSRTSTEEGKADCEPREPSGPGQTPVSLGFVADSALASRLFPSSKAPELHLRNAALRKEARVVPGLFRTNVVPVESISPFLWAPARGWKLHDAATGLATKSSTGQTGDWQMFKDGLGYGNFGNTEENGGVIISNSAHVFRAGVYTEMFDDFSGVMDAVGVLGHRLNISDRSFVPLEHSVPEGYLRKPIVDGVAKDLCRTARLKHREVNQTDWYGGKWCDYYKSISWDLPEAGALASSFVFGILGLEIKPCRAMAGGGNVTMATRRCLMENVRVYGTVLPLTPTRADPVDIELPAVAAANWPHDVEKIEVKGLRILGVSRLLISCEAIMSNDMLDGGATLRCKASTAISSHQPRGSGQPLSDIAVS